MVWNRDPSWSGHRPGRGARQAAIVHVINRVEAREHRSDAIASFAALICIAGALMGWPILDSVAAIGVAFFVGKVGPNLKATARPALCHSQRNSNEAEPPGKT